MLEAKQPRTTPGTVTLTPELRERLRVFVEAVGVREAAKRLGASAPTLAAGLAGLPLRRGSAVLLERVVEVPRAA